MLSKIWASSGLDEGKAASGNAAFEVSDGLPAVGGMTRRPSGGKTGSRDLGPIVENGELPADADGLPLGIEKPALDTQSRIAACGAAVREALLETLAPTRCVCCEHPGALLCDACRERIVPIDPTHACPHCGAPFGELLCTECHGEAGRVHRCVAATVFEGVPAKIVRAYKDGGERRLAGIIARAMLSAVREAERAAPERFAGMLSQADAVSFVPATGEAYARRGFDHMEAVARELARAAPAPYRDVLAKRGRADQRRLGRAGRRSQAAGAYEVVVPVRGARILLLDDVLTTGATLNAAAAALLRAGAASVDALAFARVWG